ncbi:hypothetical protein TIFTF001_003653 [Ficus carica]|uniref:Uncharacterized protein n=1 Tax=Ficus carica TaxID=3494 RepID=A0AA87ZI43_FICCA|nr:hypothetical protein TIFTF001_003653 [Ficus carica]
MWLLDLVDLAQSLCTWSLAKRKHLEVMGTPVRCLLRALRYLNVLCGLGYSGDPIGLNSECSRWVDTLQCRHKWAPCQSERAVDIDDGIGPVTSGVSGVRRRIMSVVSGHCRQPFCPGQWHGLRSCPIRGTRRVALVWWTCGCSTRFPRKNLSLVGSDPIGSNRSTSWNLVLMSSCNRFTPGKGIPSPDNYIINTNRHGAMN